MAVTSTITSRSKLANKNVTFGTWDGGGGGEGDINTGLTVCEFIVLTPTTKDLVCSLVEDLPADGSAITVDLAGDADGLWMAVGR
jgi:hypothetical protein